MNSLNLFMEYLVDLLPIGGVWLAYGGLDLFSSTVILSTYKD